MLRLENLANIYKDSSPNASDYGAIKRLDLTKPNNNALSTLFLIEAERFWRATLLNLFSYHHLQKVWLSTWGDVTLYYANFYSMNGLLRLTGRTITHNNQTTYKIIRENANYIISPIKGGADHKNQWNFYYDLIKEDITDNKIVKNIFKLQLDFRHYEREHRQMINYDLEHGYDEIHSSDNLLREISATLSSTFPFKETDKAFGMDAYIEISIVVYLWKYMKDLFEEIAKRTNFSDYWELQKSKLIDFVTESPINGDLKEWAIDELKN